jgi:hypothetical protein
MDAKSRRQATQLDLVLRALHDSPAGPKEILSRIAKLVTDERAKVVQSRLTAFESVNAVEGWTRSLRRRAPDPWLVKVPTRSQLYEILGIAVRDRLVGVEPQRGPGTPDPRYFLASGPGWRARPIQSVEVDVSTGIGERARLDVLPPREYSGK